MFEDRSSIFSEVLLATLDEIGIPNRLVSQMKSDGVELVGDFIQLELADLLKLPGLGQKTINHALNTLSEFNLSLSTTLPGWDGAEAVRLRERLGRRLHQKIFELRPSNWSAPLTLMGELLELLGEVEDERNVEMLSVFYGFNATGPQTLEYTGGIFGLTRERVRQISAKTESRLSKIWRPLLRLWRARQIIETELPPIFTNDDFQKAVKGAGISAVDIHIEGVMNGLRLAGESIALQSYNLDGAVLYGNACNIERLGSLLRALRKETSSNGCSNIQRLSVLAGLDISDAESVREILKWAPEVRWLDSGSTWLLSVRPTRNRLVNIASLVFSVSPAVEVNELRSALRKHRRLKLVPSPEALCQVLEHYSIASVKGNLVIANPELESVELGENARCLAVAFNALGSPVKRELLEDYCIDNLGMNVNSFYVYLSYSPLVTKLATGVFSLIGADVEPGSIDQLREEIREARFGETYGWSKLGTLWWHFQIDRPAANGGARPIPTFVHDFTTGEWVIRSIEGLILGSATVDNGFIKGLKAAFAVLGVTHRDFLQLDFDISTRQAYVQIAGDEPEEFDDTIEHDEFDTEE